MNKRLTFAVCVALIFSGLLIRPTLAQDTTSMLSVFLTALRNGQIGFPLGTNAYGYIKAQSDGVFTLFNTAQTDFARLQFGGTTSSFPSLKRVNADIQSRTADDSTYAGLVGGNVKAINGVFIGSSQVLLASATAPTISSGFGGTPSIANSNGTAAFTINVGTGAAATSGVVGLPTATTGWNCWVNDLTAAAAHVAYNTRQTASTTTTATLENQTTSTGVAIAWGANDILRVSCFAY